MFNSPPLNKGHGNNRCGAEGGKRDGETVSNKLINDNIAGGAAHAEYRHIPPKNDYSLSVGIASLLQQFTNVKVRGDFLTGKFGGIPDPNLLLMIDELRCILQPRWLGGGFAANVPRCLDAVEHYQLLGSKSELVFDFGPSVHDNKSYSEWMTILTEIANDNYWVVNFPEERCNHQFTRNEPEKEVTSDDKSVKTDFRQSIKVKHSKVHSSRDKSSKSDSQQSVKPKKSVKIEEIVIASQTSDSDSSTSSSSSSSDTTSSSSSSRPSRKSRSKKKVVKRLVVTPPVFEMDGKTSLVDFLSTYEDYFQKKYAGNKYDQTQVLASFLKGELLKIYEIRGGRKLKYKKMKEELVKYYKDKKIGSKSYWKKKLSEVHPESSESYDLFGMRLIEVAKLAYPNSKKESAQEVRKVFLKNLPPFIVAKMTDAERASKAATGHNKHLPLKSLMDMAKDLQSEGAKPKTVMWTSTMDQPNESKPNEYTKKKKNYSPPRKEYSPSARKIWSRNDRSSSRDIQCFFCRKFGHTKSECWKAAKLCLICGGKHQMEECPRYDKDYRSKSRPRSENFHKTKPFLN